MTLIFKIRFSVAKILLFGGRLKFEADQIQFISDTHPVHIRYTSGTHPVDIRFILI